MVIIDNIITVLNIWSNYTLHLDAFIYYTHLADQNLILQIVYVTDSPYQGQFESLMMLF